MIKKDRISYEDSIYQNTTKMSWYKWKFTDETNEDTEAVENAIYKYVNHPSISLIKDNIY